jgi:hypothetical protein
MPRRFTTAGLCATLSLAGLAAFSVYRARLVDASYGRYTGCETCLETSVWANDAFLFAGFAALVAASRLTRNRVARAVLAGLAVGFVLAYCLDIAVFRLLTHRLLAADLFHFAGDSTILVSVLRPLLTQAEGLLLVAGTAITLTAAAAGISSGPAKPASALGWGIAAGLLLVLATRVNQVEYIHDLAFKNLFQVNLEVDPSRAYSVANWERARGAPGLPLECEPGLAHGVSVILLVVESLSAYHSKLFSGLNDYTPQLDRIARHNTYLTHFRANGFSTESGLIALLTGRVPLPTAGRFGSTMAFTEVDGDFHRWLRQKGYRTAFFTTGPLSFGERDRWLPAIGIEHAEGAEQPFYAGMPRGPFNAAGDAALYDRFLQWLAQEGQSRPFMATLLTVATHPPYISDTGQPDEAERFREADRQIARFVALLEARGFFANGVLVIVGDHRAMTPIPDEEQERLGETAAMRIPAVVAGSGGTPRGEWLANAQQTDLIPSLRHVISERSCRNEWQGRFLGESPQAPRYVLLPDPMRRNRVTVVENAAEFTLLLDGDDTRWLASPPRPEDADRLRRQVNLERMARMAEFRAMR